MSDGLAIFSRLPPPFGGVTVHVRRLLDALDGAGIPATLYDQGGRSDPLRRVVPAAPGAAGLLGFCSASTERVVSLHPFSATSLAAAIVALRSWGRLAVPTMHSAAPVRGYQLLPAPARAAVRAALRRAHGYVCVNERLADWVRDEVRWSGPHLVVLPAFLPPSAVERDPAGLPPSVLQFAAAHPRLLVSQGFFGSTVAGRHTYGFEDQARLLASLRRDDPSWGLCTMITGVYDDAHRQQMHALRTDLRLDAHWRFVEEPIPGPALISLACVFLRPTGTDGDSVSVREALSLGVPVVASDAVPRPPGCFLHPVADASRQLTLVLAAAAGEMTPAPPPGTPLAAPVRDTRADFARFYRAALAV